VRSDSVGLFALEDPYGLYNPGGTLENPHNIDVIAPPGSGVVDVALGRIDLDEYMWVLTDDGSGNSGLHVYNIAEGPSLLQSVGFLQGKRLRLGSDSLGISRAYAVCEDQVQIVDTRTYDSAFLGGLTGIAPRDIALSGNYAFVACSGPGIQVFDVTDPFVAPGVSFPIASAFAGGLSSLAVQGDYLYAVDGSGGTFLVFDISTPTSPTLVGSLSLGGTAGDVAVRGLRAHVPTAAGLTLIDIADPNAPEVDRTVSLPGTPDGVLLYDDYAYVGCGSAGAQIVKVGPETISVSATTDVFEDGVRVSWTPATRSDVVFGVFRIASPAPTRAWCPWPPPGTPSTSTPPGTSAWSTRTAWPSTT